MLCWKIFLCLVPQHYSPDVATRHLPEYGDCSVLLSVVQISITRCHNDGCDTRIHGVRVKGYRSVPAHPGTVSVLYLYK